MSRSGVSDGDSATSSSNEELHELHRDGITIVNSDGKETVLTAVTYTTDGPTQSFPSAGHSGHSGASDSDSPTSSSNDRDNDDDRSIGNSVSLEDLDRRVDSLSSRDNSESSSNDNDMSYSRDNSSQMNHRGF